MIIEKLYDKIIYYKKLINDPKDLVDKIESTDVYCDNYTNISKWSKWTASDNQSIIYGLTKNGVFSSNKPKDFIDLEIFKISSKIDDLIVKSIEHYCLENKILKPWLPNFFSIKKYNTGVDMGPHVDSNDPTNVKHPILSGVFYLNDNYEGGEINFPNQDIVIKPEAGSLIIFPSTEPYVHHPKKITSGNKYMIPLFWYKEAF